MRKVMTTLGLMLACGAPSGPAHSEKAPRAVDVPAGFEVVTLVVEGQRSGRINAYLRRPKAAGKAPAVVGLHGCGGLFRSNGALNAREAAWADLLVEQGYAVLLPDSFNARGYRQICNIASAERPIRPRHRADDAGAAVGWLARQSFIDADRLALMGWSHGGSSVLWSVAKDFAFPGAEIKTAIAFYPGCRVPSQRTSYAPRLPLKILIGSADNWTLPVHCRTLATRYPAIRLTEYPGAVHSFDSPNSPRRTRKDAALAPSGDGRVEVGTDPKARAAAIAAVTGILADAFGTADRRR